MPSIHVNGGLPPDEFAAPYLQPCADGQAILMHTTADWGLDALEGGMTSGRTSVTLFVPGTIMSEQGPVPIMVVAETSLNMWMQATAILRARFEEEVGDPGWSVMSVQVKELLTPRYAEALRRVLPDITEEQAVEAATMFLEGLAAGAPESIANCVLCQQGIPHAEGEHRYEEDGQ